jgi:hypothetical protein
MKNSDRKGFEMIEQKKAPPSAKLCLISLGLALILLFAIFAVITRGNLFLCDMRYELRYENIGSGRAAQNADGRYSYVSFSVIWECGKVNIFGWDGEGIAVIELPSGSEFDISLADEYISSPAFSGDSACRWGWNGVDGEMAVYPCPPRIGFDIYRGVPEKDLYILLPRDHKTEQIKVSSYSVDVSEIDCEHVKLNVSNGEMSICDVSSYSLILKSRNAGASIKNTKTPYLCFLNFGGSLDIDDSKIGDITMKTIVGSFACRDSDIKTLYFESLTGRAELDNTYCGEKTVKLFIND